MWFDDYVYVNESGIAVGVKTAADAAQLLYSRAYGSWSRDYERRDQIAGKLETNGIVRFSEHIPDCSPVYLAAFKNTQRLPVSYYINAHVWELPRTRAILVAGQRARDRNQGPQVGDYCINGDKIDRITHLWDDHAQTGGGRGSFYLNSNGSASYSGGLDAGVPRCDLHDTGRRVWAEFWVFKDGAAGARRGIDIQILVNVYQRVK